jgi:hypothetical protein
MTDNATPGLLFAEAPGMRRNAMLSDDGKYRFALTREWDADKPTLVFVMLNPSTADAYTDDATIRTCIALAKRWGYGGLCVVNLYALRATDPAALLAAADPVGKNNDIAISAAASGRDVIVAWGAHAARGAGPAGGYSVSCATRPEAA